MRRASSRLCCCGYGRPELNTPFGSWYISLMFINNISPTFSLGSFAVHYYSLFFALGVVLDYSISKWLWKKKGWNMADFDSLIVYLFLGLVIGARLGEVFFYHPVYYFSEPVRILKVWEGGLSSHGATVGLVGAYVLFWVRHRAVPFSKYIDLMAVPMPLVAGFVRLGNFFNSEIVGRATDSPLGVVFARNGEDFARHPVQLYEGLLAWGTFAILIFLYLRALKGKCAWAKNYFFLFLFIGIYFTGRFFLEFLKEYQIGFESLLPFGLTMGQILSIAPALVAFGYFVFVYPKMQKRG